jgi:CBS domain-containing protein
MKHSIMTEKIARRGARVLSEYTVDDLSRVLARDAMSAPVITLDAGRSVAEARAFLSTGGVWTDHQGFPVIDDAGLLVGIVTRRDLAKLDVGDEATVASLVSRPPIVVYDDHSLRDAADRMVASRIGRLPVVRRDAPGRVIGILTRSDLLEAHARGLDEATRAEPHLRPLRFRPPRRAPAGPR